MATASCWLSERTRTPMYGCTTTRPLVSSVLSASRTGVFDIENSCASSDSTSACPGASCPLRMRCLIVASANSVRDGGDAGMAGVIDTSYVIYEDGRNKRGSSPSSLARTKNAGTSISRCPGIWVLVALIDLCSSKYPTGVESENLHRIRGFHASTRTTGADTLPD